MRWHSPPSLLVWPSAWTQAKRGKKMTEILIIIGIVAVLIVDWLIVMGPDPRRWKGGDKDE